MDPKKYDEKKPNERKADDIKVRGIHTLNRHIS